MDKWYFWVSGGTEASIILVSGSTYPDYLLFDFDDMICIISHGSIL